MKKLVILLSAFAFVFTSCGEGKSNQASAEVDAEGNAIEAVKEETKPEKRKTGARVKSEADSISYAVGTDLGMHLKNNVKGALAEDFNLDKIFAAIKDVLRDRPTLTPDESNDVLRAYFTTKVPERQKAAAAAFLEKVKKDNPNVQETESGLLYEIIEVGSEVKVTDKQDKVKVHYTGALKDGEKFDSSYDRGSEPTEFVVGNVIPGWTEGLMLVGEGGKIKLWIPSDLGYGERGQPYAGIGPNEPLVFDVELISVVPAEK